VNPASVTRDLVGAYNHHDLAAYRDHHAAGCRVEFPDDGDIALDEWLSSLAALFTAMPDLAVDPVTFVADDVTAVLELRQTGTHTGPLALGESGRALLGTDIDHVPPTGRGVATHGVVILRFSGDAVTLERHHWPHLWLYEALGLLTRP
jgi:hypothetical protein